MSARHGCVGGVLYILVHVEDAVVPMQTTTDGAGTTLNAESFSAIKGNRKFMKRGFMCIFVFQNTCEK